MSAAPTPVYFRLVQRFEPGSNECNGDCAPTIPWKHANSTAFVDLPEAQT